LLLVLLLKTRVGNLEGKCGALSVLHKRRRKKIGKETRQKNRAPEVQAGEIASGIEGGVNHPMKCQSPHYER